MQTVKQQIMHGFRMATEMTKFKLSLLNGFVTVCSFSLYPSPASCLPLFFSSVSLSMSTQCLNQYVQIQKDKLMIRTRRRPLPSGALNPRWALFGGLGLGVLGLASMGSYYNLLTAGIGAAIWGGYLFCYTPMKGLSEWNTMAGSVVGSLPVYLGWAAAGRSMCMAQPFALFCYMMAWQHQHFYGIRWLYFDDYQRAGFKMERSKNIAALLVIVQTLLAGVMISYASMHYGINQSFLINTPVLFCLYKWGLEPAMKFSQGLCTAKQLKMHSYKHFCVVFTMLLVCRIFGEPDLAEKRGIAKSGADCIFSAYL